LDANGNTFPYRKLIHVASLKARIGWQSLRSDEFVDEGPYCVTGTDFQNGKINWSTAYHVSTERYEMDENIQLNEGDLLVTKDGTIGKVAVVHGLDAPATLNSGVFVVRPKTNTLSTDFLSWVVRSKVFDDFVAFNFSGSTINHLYQNVFETFRFPFPDLATQRQIADFLDRETARIDLLIEKKQRLVALLGEERSAVISHSVTKGIDPDAPMKDSGEAWLGQIPEHWEVVPPTVLFTQSKERARDGDEMLSATQKYGVIPLAEFEALEQRQVTKAFTNLELRKHVEIGDFVISMRSMDGGLERAHATGSVRSSYSVLKAGPDVEGRFYGAVLKSSLYIQALRLTSNFIRDGQDMNFGHFRKIRLPKLSLTEQTEIADYLEAETTRIDKVASKTSASIELLKEYRSALITAAVTGQIDVTTHAKSGTPDRRLDAIQEKMGA
jgi:type I restriction enzyme S subunit